MDNGWPEATIKASVALITTGSATQGWALMTLDMATTPGTREDSGRTNATGIVLGRTRTNKLGQRRKEVGIYVPADVNNKDNDM
jgi:hypothetical protein